MFIAIIEFYLKQSMSSYVNYFCCDSWHENTLQVISTLFWMFGGIKPLSLSQMSSTVNLSDPTSKSLPRQCKGLPC